MSRPIPSHRFKLGGDAVSMVDTEQQRIARFSMSEAAESAVQRCNDDPHAAVYFSWKPWHPDDVHRVRGHV